MICLFLTLGMGFLLQDMKYTQMQPGVQGCMVVVMEWELGLHLGYGPNIFDQAGMDGHTGLEVS